MSEFSPEGSTAQGGGPGPFAAPQDDAPRGPSPVPAGFGTGVGAPNGGPNGAPNGGPHPGPNGAAQQAPGRGPAPGNGGPGLAGVPNGAPVTPSRGLAPVVKGRIEVADEVVEKVAALAAIEVEGVADMGGDFERAIESVRERIGIGQKRGDQGVKARITGRDVAVDVVVMVQYGYVVMDVARQVQSNVAVQTHRMLGLNVVEVNVTVDDVKLPEPEKAEKPEEAPYAGPS